MEILWLEAKTKISKSWLCEKFSFKLPNSNPWHFHLKGVLGHNSWCFGNMRLQVLKWKNNGIKWMLELKVVMSQSWKKCWLFVRKILSFSSKMTYNVLPLNMVFHLKFALDKKMAWSRSLKWHFETWTAQNLQSLRKLWLVEVGKNSWNNL